jgi:predicted amidophosphoribosyltransferase
VPICEECLASFEAPLEKKCEVCGQALAWMTVREGEPLVCRACQQKTYAFERARSYGIYDGPLGE